MIENHNTNFTPDSFIENEKLTSEDIHLNK